MTLTQGSCTMWHRNPCGIPAPLYSSAVQPGLFMSRSTVTGSFLQ